MAIRKVITTPKGDNILRKKTEKIKDFGSELEKLAKDLVDTVRSAEEPEGAGLAATQIGVSKRVCVVRDFMEDPANKGKIMAIDYVLVNPKIVSHSKETEVDWEGCLSVPDVYGEVERYKKIKVDYQNTEGEKMRIKATEYFARVIQHEIDHLDGILFTDKLAGKPITEKEYDKLFEY